MVFELDPSSAGDGGGTVPGSRQNVDSQSNTDMSGSEMSGGELSNESGGSVPGREAPEGVTAPENPAPATLSAQSADVPSNGHGDPQAPVGFASTTRLENYDETYKVRPVGESGGAPGAEKSGLKVRRLFTRDAAGAPVDPYSTVEWVERSTRITNPDGSTVFELDEVEVPSTWSQVAVDILASKYFRKAGVPVLDEKRSPILDNEGKPLTTHETSARQVVHRMVNCWRHWGESYDYFSSSEDAANFESELTYMLLHQMAAPNSPQWFNTGLHQAYGLEGPAQGHYYVDPVTEVVQESVSAYSRPQPHACFIQSIRDDLVNEGGIMDLWMREARLFKYGSGTGTNFSVLRGEGEPLSGGGVSSGLMSFLKIGDRAAGAIKSGGTTRRAAKMVCLDLDHPDVERFVNWKVEEEDKVAALIEKGYSSDFNGDAYLTVSGQNSNNSVRIPDSFFQALEEDGSWHLRWRTDGTIAKSVKARDLWGKVCNAAWRCADPGVQFDTTINDWNTCPQDGRINASNPCSEYMFLDDTACNLASLNLLKFYDPATGCFDLQAYRHAIRLWTIVLEISVLMAQYPSREIAHRSYLYRTLGLGYANLGTLLMVQGIPYDSPQGRAVCGALTSILTGDSYAASAELASTLGPFPAYHRNREDMLRVIRNHRRAAYQAASQEYESLSTAPEGIDPTQTPTELLEAARHAWDQALLLGEKYGFRNAQATVLAPTGTIGLLMDCDTTGIEPDYSLVKFKKLAGGGYFKIVNQSVSEALARLGYSASETQDIVDYVIGTSRVPEAAESGDAEGEVNRETLIEKGFDEEAIKRVEESLPKVFDLKSAFSPWSLGEEVMKSLGFNPQEYVEPSFDLLASLGFSAKAIARANDRMCGQHTVEGAPHLKDDHLAVFDCANRCGRLGTRFIQYLGHVRMMAAAQPFISGAISKTINLPTEATHQDIETAYKESWKLGLKANALYRDGCKLSQPLSNQSESGDSETETETESSDVSVTATKEDVSPASVPLPVVQEADLGPRRRPMPSKRMGFTQEAKVSGHKIYLRTGNYEDGALGEIFIDMHKEGAAYRSMMNCFAIAVSKGLQYGVPLDEFVDTFTFTRFAPQGMVEGHPNLKMATSILDYVFRVLGVEYLDRTELAHVKPATDGDPAEKGVAGGSGRLADPEAAGNAAGVSSPLASAAVADAPVTEDVTAADSVVKEDGTLSQQLSEMMGDAPICDNCGHITVRNGACYRCLNCGSSMGCS